jgi:DNA invertase Pin-like site-specific DNA recombinase
MPTCFLYSRVSTEDQNLSPAWQAEVCKNHYEFSLKSKGYALHPEVFHDHGVSAYHVDWRDRPRAREMFNLVKPGDIIVVAKQDRAFRSSRDRENTFYFLNKVGIDIVILDAMLDTSTAAGKFAASVIAAQCQFESDVKSERQKAAHSIRRQRKTPMKKLPPPGWKLDKMIDELVPDWDERRLMATVYDQRDKGYRSVAEAVRVLKAAGTLRANGCKYTQSWFTRAYSVFLRNFPCEGYQCHCRSEHKAKAHMKVGKLVKKRKDRIAKLVRPHDVASPASQQVASQPAGY